MINFSLQTQLQIFTPSTNKALELILKNASPQELAALSKGRDLSDVLENILQKSAQDPKQNSLLLDLLKNNPTLKSLGDMQSSLSSLKSLLSDEKLLTKLEQKLASLLENIQTIDPKNLQKKVLNSGVFLESNLKNATQTQLGEVASQDLKALLLKAKEELSNTTSAKSQELLKQLDKTLLQIDYFQLHSRLYEGSSFYLPYSWDDLRDAKISLKQPKEQLFICDIELTLQSHGELQLRLALFEKRDLTIHIQTKSDALKSAIVTQLHELKSALTKLSINPKEIRFLEEKNSSTYESFEDIGVGFEVKA